MDRFLSTDAQRAKIEPHCGDKVLLFSESAMIQAPTQLVCGQVKQDGATFCLTACKDAIGFILTRNYGGSRIFAYHRRFLNVTNSVPDGTRSAWA
jgi:hypothetical protein